MSNHDDSDDFSPMGQFDYSMEADKTIVSMTRVNMLIFKSNRWMFGYWNECRFNNFDPLDWVIVDVPPRFLTT